MWLNLQGTDTESPFIKVQGEVDVGEFSQKYGLKFNKNNLTESYLQIE